MISNESPSSAVLDRAGVTVGIACAAHCVVLPSLALLPALSLSLPLVEAAWVEWGFVGLSAGLGLFAIGRHGFSRHGRRHPLGLFAVGLVMLLLARMEWVPEAWPEALPVTIGAGLVVAAHIRNLACSRLCVTCADGAAC